MNGILLVDKPAEWTSMDVCAHLRGVLHEKHIGHTGTLDPNATGLLVVLVGKATKLARFLEADEKVYEARMRPGLVTDTQDIWGNTLSGASWQYDPDRLEEALAAFRGPIDQLPPMYSAIKRKGKKLYEIARRGGEVERDPRPIVIHELTCTGIGEDGDILLRIRCSKGTYIRTLCHDIGAALGCGACMSALRRTAAGRFSLSDAHTLEEIRERGEELLLPPELLPERTDV